MTRPSSAEPSSAVSWASAPTSRERVLQAAAELFRRQGFDRTSMREVAELAGLGKSSLYHHIPSKQELLGEIVDRGVDQLMSALERVAAADLPASERLRRAVRTQVLTYIEHRDSVACFIQEGRALRPAQRQAYVAKRDRYEAWFRQIVADGIASGEFRPTNVKLAVFAVLGMCHWVVRWYRPDGAFPPEQIADHFADFAVSALLASPRPDSERDAAAPLPLGPAWGDGPESPLSLGEGLGEGALPSHPSPGPSPSESAAPPPPRSSPPASGS